MFILKKIAYKFGCLKELVSGTFWLIGSKLLKKLYMRWLKLYDENDFWCYAVNSAGLTRKDLADTVRELSEGEEIFAETIQYILTTH